MLSNLGIKLSLPYNFAEDYINKVLLPYKDITAEVYLAMFWAISPSARNWMGASNHLEYIEKVDRLYSTCKQYNIRLNFIANTEMDPRQSRLVVDEAQSLHQRYKDSSFTFRSLETAMLLKRECPDAEISPSTLSFVDSVIKAMYWRKAVNPRVITVAREINRRPNLLKQLKNMGFLLKIVPQDTCIPYCPVMYEHDKSIELRDMLSNTSVVNIPMRAAECRPFAMRIKADPNLFWLVATKDILPGHLHHLKGLVDLLKIEGRQNSSDGIRRKIEYYVQAKSLKSFEIVYYEEPPEAWEKIAHCDRNCFACTWCRQNIRFIGASNRELVSETGHELGKDTEDDGFYTALRVDFVSNDKKMSIEIYPAYEGLPYFVKTQRFALAYTQDTPDRLMSRVIRYLKKMIEAKEMEPGFDILSIKSMIKTIHPPQGFSLNTGLVRKRLPLS